MAAISAQKEVVGAAANVEARVTVTMMSEALRWKPRYGLVPPGDAEDSFGTENPWKFFISEPTSEVKRVRA